MAQQTEGTITIEAPASDIMEVIGDFESYPEWSDVKTAEVRARDGQGRASEVTFEVSVPVLGDARYTLAYEYAPDDGGVSWTTVEIEGSIRDIAGEYVMEELDEEETEVTYRLRVDLTVSVPGMIRRQGERRVIKTALDGLKERVESRR